MKPRCKNSVSNKLNKFSRICLHENDAVNQALSQAKATLLHEYSGKVESNGRLLQLALQEAEALAWQTGFPHLVFPVLATEKAQAAVRWHQRQSEMNQTREVAFAA